MERVLQSLAEGERARGVDTRALVVGTARHTVDETVNGVPVTRAASMLHKRGHWIRLVRVGSALRHATRRRMIELSLGDVVELPFVDRDVLRALYERCDLLLLTSDREGYGLPVLEAFAAGKPVVASDIPALRESSGGLARVVPPDSLHDWVAAIEDVLRTGDPTGALAAERRAHAAARTWDDHVRGLLPVYGELLDRRP